MKADRSALLLSPRPSSRSLARFVHHVTLPLPPTGSSKPGGKASEEEKFAYLDDERTPEPRPGGMVEFFGDKGKREEELPGDLLTGRRGPRVERRALRLEREGEGEDDSA